MQISNVMTSYCRLFKMGKYWFNNISRNICVEIFKLGTISQSQKGNKMTSVMLLSGQRFCYWSFVNIYIYAKTSTKERFLQYGNYACSKQDHLGDYFAVNEISITAKYSVYIIYWVTVNEISITAKYSVCIIYWVTTSLLQKAVVSVFRPFDCGKFSTSVFVHEPCRFRPWTARFRVLPVFITMFCPCGSQVPMYIWFQAVL